MINFEALGLNLNKDYLGNTGINSNEKGSDLSIFGNNSSNTNEAANSDTISLASSLKSEESRVQSENNNILSDAFQNLSGNITDKVAARLIQNAMNVSNKNFRLNLSDVVDLPSVNGVNGGSVQFAISGISEKGISIIGILSDIATASISGQVANSSSVVSSSSITVPFDDEILKQEILKYLSANNYTNVIKSMQPGETRVLEFDENTGEPVIWATKESGGNTKITIQKEGINISLDFTSDDKEFSKLTQADEKPEEKSNKDK
ncbi:MAG: hypothetical protein A2Y25_02970 [Candidatus Melainabacteria bacterium GWF2_37_15]|nr:MAG: hypothetical protein A2Y25_02970 [Candidatus Melainabacteria bacterium GWF2_37_15]